MPVTETRHCLVPVLSRSAKTSFPGRGPLRCAPWSFPPGGGKVPRPVGPARPVPLPLRGAAPGLGGRAPTATPPARPRAPPRRGGKMSLALWPPPAPPPCPGGVQPRILGCAPPRQPRCPPAHGNRTGGRTCNAINRSPETFSKNKNTGRVCGDPLPSLPLSLCAGFLPGPRSGTCSRHPHRGSPQRSRAHAVDEPIQQEEEDPVGRVLTHYSRLHRH